MYHKASTITVLQLLVTTTLFTRYLGAPPPEKIALRSILRYNKLWNDDCSFGSSLTFRSNAIAIVMATKLACLQVGFVIVHYCFTAKLIKEGSLHVKLMAARLYHDLMAYQTCLHHHTS